jgi:hypothetical protein
MRTRVLVAAATFVVAGFVTSCDRTTPGTVAMTTEPGAPLRTSTSRPTPSSPRTTTPRTSSPGTSSPGAPPSGDPLDTTCQEYVGLDEASQAAVIDAILSDEKSVFGPEEAELAKTLADAACTFLPTSKVSEILLGETPP